MRRLLELFVLLLAAVTIMFPRWIETVLGVDPDQGSGLLEVLILVVCAAVVLLAGARLLRPVVRRLR